MATRRPARASVPEPAAFSTPAEKLGPSDVRPAVPSAVIYKLLAFTLAMVTLPIGTYFATVRTVFRGNSTYAGATAALMANVVLVAYVIVAMREDQSERAEEQRERAKKEE